MNYNSRFSIFSNKLSEPCEISPSSSSENCNLISLPKPELQMSLVIGLESIFYNFS